MPGQLRACLSAPTLHPVGRNKSTMLGTAEDPNPHEIAQGIILLVVVPCIQKSKGVGATRPNPELQWSKTVLHP